MHLKLFQNIISIVLYRFLNIHLINTLLRRDSGIMELIPLLRAVIHALAGLENELDCPLLEGELGQEEEAPGDV